MHALAARWPLPALLDVRDALLEAYGSQTRGYHDVVHLTEVLDRVDELTAVVDTDRTAVRLAAWFHDAVYDDAPQPEERSARWALRALAGTPYAEEVARLVRLTEHHLPGPDDPAGAVLCDADLAILAAAPQRYEQYTAGVRREYAAFDDATFAAGRLAVLEALAQGPLFHTVHAREHWAPRARLNLGRELDALRSGTPT